MSVFTAYSQEEVIDELKHRAPHAEIHLDDEIAAKHAANGKAESTIDGRILAYVAVGDKDDIRGVLKTAIKFHLPIVPQTADTSTVIGADGLNGGIILSLARMNKIVEVNEDDLLAVVEPGVINQDLDQAARQHGLFYAPDPASKPISSIGGNVSTNAGGLSGVKYGATKDSVLGLKVMLANGKEIKVGGRTTKQAFGYNLTQLFVGSEGTLGIITEITLRLFPIPIGKKIYGVAFFDNMAKLAEGVHALRISGLYPSMLEGLDGKTVQALDQYKQTHYAKSASSSMLIFMFDDAGETQLQISQKILQEQGAWKIQITDDPAQGEKLIQLRRDMLPAVFANGKYYIMEDMAVPSSKLAEMADYIVQVGDELQVNIYTAGHAGDGNLHPTLLWNDQPQAPANVIEATRRLFHKALDLGGTISGEHAVGMSKNQWNNEELGEDVDVLQHQIKTLFDPMNILNPKRKIN
ncbi:FAD-binding oxidoreductase [Liquorilactobacillus vini]|uniref:Lactate dehydrogenase (Oxidoreductase) n=2 Tax=Liquorilactobacillus vini TaxID=238015 RepID=A0A0R2CLQ1_9LACO|nr:FAD-linked oxidase C-terminal domain-containing protein [Liquorilactobacillus vini]KRM89481.1 lactate dehydrogenase (oxidoreductase) [Liquorilactobacillus vini DSM 20605]